MKLAFPLRILRALTLPGAVVLLGVAGFVHWAHPEAVAAAARWLPYGIYAATVLLAWRFNRSGLVFSALALAAADAALTRYAGGEQHATEAGVFIYVATAFLLPLNLAGFSLMGQRGTWLRRAAEGVGALAGQGLVVALVAWLAPGAVAAVLQFRFDKLVSGGPEALGHLPLLAFLLGGLFFVTLALLGRRATDHGYLWALAAAFLAVRARGEALSGLDGAAGNTASVYFATGGVILAVSVIEASFRLAYRDELTGALSRRAFNEALLKLGDRYAIAMVDVDHFKKFNDRFGHDVGDQVLRMVASQLEKVGGNGRAYRYGGEEFAIIFPNLTADDALPHLEALRKSIHEVSFRLRALDRPKQKPKKPRASGEQREVKVSISAGVAQPARGRILPDEVVKAADKALYRAKEEGRNRVKKFSYFW